MEWISVDEQLPEDRQEVLTYWPKRDQIQVHVFYEDYMGLGSWWMYGYQNNRLKDNQITHWMPLPAMLRSNLPKVPPRHFPEIYEHEIRERRLNGDTESQ